MKRQNSGKFRSIFYLGLLIIVGLFFANVGCSLRSVTQFFQPPPSAITEAPLIEAALSPAIQGRLVYDQPNGKLWSMSLVANALVAPGESVPLFRLPPGTFAFQPVWSAVNQQIAYGYIQPDTATGNLSSARLWVADIDGSNAKSITHPAPDFTGTYRDPAWSPDGRTLWTTVQLPEKDAAGVVRFRSEIRRVDVASGDETVIIPNGRGAAISPNGQWIAYLAPGNSGDGMAIWRSKTDGSDTSLLVPSDRFEEIYIPMRFSPDGQALAFAAADAQNQLQRTPGPKSNSWFPGPFQALSFQTIQLQRLTALFRPRPVHAHGLYPADVWLVDVETGELERLTQLSEDHPTPVWSPDGHNLAFAGVLGIYLIDVAERSAIRLTDQGIDGQIEWIGE
ncbi:MAG: DPP IV N-terminal domain-containing protein [Chloroflexota bacterium]